jgi:hypothetical protein
METSFYTVGSSLVRVQENNGVRDMRRLGLRTAYWLYYGGLNFEKADKISEDEAIAKAHVTFTKRGLENLTNESVRKFLYASNEELIASLEK